MCCTRGYSAKCITYKTALKGESFNSDPSSTTTEVDIGGGGKGGRWPGRNLRYNELGSNEFGVKEEPQYEMPGVTEVDLIASGEAELGMEARDVQQSPAQEMKVPDASMSNRSAPSFKKQEMLKKRSLLL